MQKNIFFLGKFYFFKKKGDISDVFLLFTASVRSRPPGPSAVPGVFVCGILFRKNKQSEVLGFVR